MYVALGLGSVFYMPDFFAADLPAAVLICVGGILYIAGAVFYGLKRPNPIPGVFGFHEIFHTLTLLAFLCHWTGIFLVAAQAWPAFNAEVLAGLSA